MGPCIKVANPGQHNLKLGVTAVKSGGHELRARLHQASASTLWQLCDDASDSVLIEINGDA